MTDDPDDPNAPGGEPRGVVAFDNAGTLSETSVVRADLAPAADWATPVPTAPPDRGTVALLAVDDEGVDALRTDDPLGPTVARADVPVHLALANRAVTPERARAALVAADGVPARAVPERLDRARARAGGDRPAGAQVVVLVDAERAVRAIGYTTTPKPAAGDAIRWTRAAGFEPRLVSGDGAAALRAVADAVGIAPDAVHAYQSTDGKRRTVERLGESGPVVMVGNGPNDRRAFAAADAAVLVAPDGRPDSPGWLTTPVDVVVSGPGGLPDALDLDAVAARGSRSGSGSGPARDADSDPTDPDPGPQPE